MQKKKLSKLKMALTIIAAIIFAAGLILSVYATAVQLAPVKIVMDLSREYQAFEGFGTSMCWCVRDIGEDEAAAERAAQLLYGDSGMRLEVYRYNIGAGSKETDCDYAGSNHATESFFISENYTSESSFSDPENYDFTRDAASMRVFENCVKTGNVRTVVLFANSPHYLLTENGYANGTGDYENNLPEKNYGAFCDYLLIIAGHFAQRLAELKHSPLVYISPVNEPQWRWNNSGWQEGCHFDPKPLAKFYSVFCGRLKEYNAAHGMHFLPDIFESGDYCLKGKYQRYINEFKKYDYFDGLDHLSFHSYHANNGRFFRSAFSYYAGNSLNGKSIHMSEYCEMKKGVSQSIDRGLYAAGVIMKDLTLVSAAQWCWWVGASDGNFEDGLTYYDAEAEGDKFRVTKRYYAMSQFSRYISAGDKRIYASTREPLHFNGVDLCAFKKPDGKVALVIINERSFSRRIKLPAGFTAESAVCTDKTRNTEEIAVSRNMKIPAKSITTLTLV